jgi:hypothetical protein
VGGEASEVFVVTGAIGQLDVERARDFVEWVVSATMHAEGEDTVITGEDGVRAVPLMYVEVDDSGTTNASGALKRSHSDSDVVEDTESLAMIGERVVRSAGKVHRNSVVERRTRGFTSSADRPQGTLDQRRRPGESEPPELGGGETSFEKPIDVAGSVDEQQRIACGARGLTERLRRDDTTG